MTRLNGERIIGLLSICNRANPFVGCLFGNTTHHSVDKANRASTRSAARELGRLINHGMRGSRERNPLMHSESENVENAGVNVRR
jgi:hypothetical protein